MNLCSDLIFRSNSKTIRRSSQFPDGQADGTIRTVELSQFLAIRMEAPMFSKILICTDGSEHAIHAAEAAADIAKKFGSEVLMINVLTHVMEPALLAIDAGPASWDSAEEAYEKAQADIEGRTSAIFQRAGIRFDTIRERGHAADKIVEIAEQEKVDLIVMGSRGLGTFTRLVLGSVSDGVIHHAHCPVLIVR